MNRSELFIEKRHTWSTYFVRNSLQFILIALLLVRKFLWLNSRKLVCVYLNIILRYFLIMQINSDWYILFVRNFHNSLCNFLLPRNITIFYNNTPLCIQTLHNPDILLKNVMKIQIYKEITIYGHLVHVQLYCIRTLCQNIYDLNLT